MLKPRSAEKMCKPRRTVYRRPLGTPQGKRRRSQPHLTLPSQPPKQEKQQGHNPCLTHRSPGRRCSHSPCCPSSPHRPSSCHRWPPGPPPPAAAPNAPWPLQGRQASKPTEGSAGGGMWLCGSNGLGAVRTKMHHPTQPNKPTTQPSARSKASRIYATKPAKPWAEWVGARGWR